MFKRKLSVLAQLALLGSSAFAMDSGSCPFSKADVMRGFYGDNLDQTILEAAIKDNKVTISGVAFTIKPTGKSDWRFPNLSEIRSTAFSDRFLNGIKIGNWSEDSLKGVDIACTGSGNKRTLHFTLNPFYATTQVGFEKRLRDKGAVEALKIGWPKLTYDFVLEGNWPSSGSSSSYKKQQEEQARKEKEAREEKARQEEARRQWEEEQERVRREKEAREEKARQEEARRWREEQQERVRKAKEEQARKEKEAREENARQEEARRWREEQERFRKAQEESQRRYEEQERLRKAQEESKRRYEEQERIRKAQEESQRRYEEQARQSSSSSSNTGYGSYGYSQPKPQYEQPSYNQEAEEQPKIGDVRINNAKKERWNGSRWVRM
jgi:hypothetical protein